MRENLQELAMCACLAHACLLVSVSLASRAFLSAVHNFFSQPECGGQCLGDTLLYTMAIAALCA